jgi:preprotein translocase subunit Sec61beta
MEKQNNSMPQSIAGIARYSQDDTGKLKFSPTAVIITLVIVVGFVLYLHSQGL